MLTEEAGTHKIPAEVKMPTTKKIFAVQNLAEKFKQAKGVILADYSGLNVSQMNELRREIKKAGGEFEVVKNSLFLLATKTDLPLVSLSGILRGPTVALWLYQEDFSPLKALDNFIKRSELPKIKFGFWQGEEISLERISQLANLPGLSELQTRLVSLLQSPSSRLVWALNSNLAKLVFILKAKAGGGEN